MNYRKPSFKGIQVTVYVMGMNNNDGLITFSRHSTKPTGRLNTQKRLSEPTAPRLLAQVQRHQQLLIAFAIGGLEIGQVFPPLADQLQQALPRAVVFFVGFEVRVQLPNALRDQRHLHFRRPVVPFMQFELLNDLTFPFLIHHSAPGLALATEPVKQ